MLTAWGFSLEKILFCVNKLRKALDKTLHADTLTVRLKLST